LKKVTKTALALILSLCAASPAAAHGHAMSFLYGGTTTQYNKYMQNAEGVLNSVSPDYFEVGPDGGLVIPKMDAAFIRAMHDKGVKVTPFITNHWDRPYGENAMANTEALTSQIAEAVYGNALDGVIVDIENLPAAQRDPHTAFVRRLRDKLPDRILSVAVAANPYRWTAGWHGSYDYAGLARSCDYLIVMGYDESYYGGPAGPVASAEWVRKSIEYALQNTTPDKIVLGMPFYGRYWKEGDAVGGHGLTAVDITNLIDNYETKKVYHDDLQTAELDLTLKDGEVMPKLWGGRVLTPGKYKIWYDDLQSTAYKLKLVESYGLLGSGSWALGQDDARIWVQYAGYKSAAAEPTPAAGEPAPAGTLWPASTFAPTAAPTATVPTGRPAAAARPTASPTGLSAVRPTPTPQPAERPTPTPRPTERPAPTPRPMDQPAPAERPAAAARQAEAPGTGGLTNPGRTAGATSFSNEWITEEYLDENGNTVTKDTVIMSRSQTRPSGGNEGRDGGAETETGANAAAGTGGAGGLNIAYMPDRTVGANAGTGLNEIPGAGTGMGARGAVARGTPAAVDFAQIMSGAGTSAGAALHYAAGGTQPFAGNAGVTQPNMTSYGAAQPYAGNAGASYAGAASPYAAGGTQPYFGNAGISYAGAASPYAVGGAQPFAGNAGVTQPNMTSYGATQPYSGNAGTSYAGAASPYAVGGAQPFAGNAGVTQPNMTSYGATQPYSGNAGASYAGAASPYAAGGAQPFAGNAGAVNAGTANFGNANTGAANAGNANAGAVNFGAVSPYAGNFGMTQPYAESYGAAQPYAGNAGTANAGVTAPFTAGSAGGQPFTASYASVQPYLANTGAAYNGAVSPNANENGTARPYAANNAAGAGRPYGADTVTGGGANVGGAAPPYANNYGAERPYGSSNAAGAGQPYGSNAAAGAERPYGANAGPAGYGTANAAALSGGPNTGYPAGARSGGQGRSRVVSDTIKKGWFSEREYDENAVLTRGQAIKVIMRMATLLPDPASGADVFGDAGNGPDRFFIRKAMYYGIAEGDGNGNFNPQAPITKQDLIMYMDRVFSLPDTVDFDTGKIRDIDKHENPEAFYAINKYLEHGIISVDANGNFYPHSHITMREMAEITDRLSGVGVKDLEPILYPGQKQRQRILEPR